MSDAARANWGRWGKADQRGAANFADAEVIRRAAGLVRRGQVVGLGIPLRGRGVPTFEDSPAPFHAMLLDGGDYAAGVELPNGFCVADDYIALGCHSTTHVDALAHVWYEGELYNGHRGDLVRSYGATRCGIEQLGQLVTRGVLIDVAAAKGVTHLAAGYTITPDDIDDAAARGGVVIEQGDCVLVRTGWWTVFASDRDAYYLSAPGVGLAAARHLAEMNVSAVGADTRAFEVVPERGTFEGGSLTPVSHPLLIRDHGIYILELLDLEELSAAQAYEFMFVLAPLRISGGTGSPVNPTAIF